MTVKNLVKDGGRVRVGVAAAMLSLLAACASQPPTESTIAQVLAAPDDSQVVLTGALVQQTDSEHLLLRDGTGQIMVEVDDDVLGEVKFAPDARVRVQGTVERDSTRSMVHAKTVSVVN